MEQKTVSILAIVFLNFELSLLFFVLACSKEDFKNLPYYNSPDFSPIFITNQDSISTKITHHIADFSFTNQNGKIVTNKNIEGKIHVANFIFTSCGNICPVMAKHMKLVQNEFRTNNDIVLLSYTVMPWIDDVKTLANYAKNNQIESNNWHLLTGNKSDIYSLARQSYFAEEDIGFSKDSTQFLHTEHIVLIDKQKRIRGIYNGTLQLEAEQLIKDIKQLREE